MTKQKSILENTLEEAIEEIETEKKERNCNAKDLERKISGYRVALNHAKSTHPIPLPKTPKPKNLRFQPSPQ